MKTTAAYFSCA